MTDSADNLSGSQSAPAPGFFRIVRVNGIPIDVHWTCFLGGLVLDAWHGFNPYLLLPLIVGYLCVVLVHEAGHAFAASVVGVKVLRIRMRGLGGATVTEPIPGASATAIVFSAGLVAQTVLFAATLLAQQKWGRAEEATLRGLAYAFTVGNVMIFIWSLWPSTSRAGQPTDGRVLLSLALDRLHGRTVLGGTLPSMNAADRSPVFSPETALLTISELVPPGFQQGVEILNDRQTPLDFVVDVLMRHLGSNGRQAIDQAVKIHNRGGLLFPLASMGEAERVASAIANDAVSAGLPFVCRAVRVE